MAKQSLSIRGDRFGQERLRPDLRVIAVHLLETHRTTNDDLNSALTKAPVRLPLGMEPIRVGVERSASGQAEISRLVVAVVGGRDVKPVSPHAESSPRALPVVGRRLRPLPARLKHSKSAVGVPALHGDEPAAAQILVEANAAEDDGGVFSVEIDDLRRQAITKFRGTTRNAILRAADARNSEPIAVTHTTHHAAVPTLAKLSRPPTLDVDRFAFAEHDADNAPSTVSRLLRGHAEHTASRICPVESTTRPSNELHGGQVVQRKRKRRPSLVPEEGKRQVMTVLKHGNAAAEGEVEPARSDIEIPHPPLSDLCSRRELDQLGDLALRRLSFDSSLTDQTCGRGRFDDAFFPSRHAPHDETIGEALLPIDGLFNLGGRPRCHLYVGHRGDIPSQAQRDGIRPWRQIGERKQTVGPGQMRFSSLSQQHTRTCHAFAVSADETTFDTPRCVLGVRDLVQSTRERPQWRRRRREFFCERS